MVNQLMEQMQRGEALHVKRSQPDMAIRNDIQIVKDQSSMMSPSDDSAGRQSVDYSKNSSDKAAREIIRIINELRQLLQFHQLDKLSWTHDSDLISF